MKDLTPDQLTAFFQKAGKSGVYERCYMDLIADKVTEPGYLPERKARTTGGMRASAAYERLVAVGNMLMESIKRSRGRDNKSLARFADQLRQLLEKWES